MPILLFHPSAPHHRTLLSTFYAYVGPGNVDGHWTLGYGAELTEAKSSK